jgi:hypothetical protein
MAGHCRIKGAVCTALHLHLAAVLDAYDFDHVQCHTQLTNTKKMIPGRWLRRMRMAHQVTHMSRPKVPLALVAALVGS